MSVLESIRPRTVAGALVPAALLVLLAAQAVAARIYYSAHRFNPSQMVLSDFESPDDNPRGYLIAAAGTAAACALLFPAANLFRRVLHPSRWAAAGAWIYTTGSVSGITMAGLEPLLDPFHPLHILLAFTTFLGFIGGLMCVSIAAARANLHPNRTVWSAAALTHLIAILMALGIVPLPRRGSFGFINSLAAGELALIGLVGFGTAALAMACHRR